MGQRGLKLTLEARDSWTKVVDGDAASVEWLKKFISFRDSQAERKRRIVQGRRGEVWVSAVQRGRFGTGLLPTVLRGAGACGVEVELHDRRTPPPPGAFPDLTGEPLTLYPDQQGALRDWWMGGVEQPCRGIIKSPTASGKGRLAVAAAHALPGHTLFVVHRGNLVQDVRTRWDDLLASRGLEPRAGWIGEGRWAPGERLTCATLQTLYEKLGTKEIRRLAKYTTAVVVDECHTAAARTYGRTIQFFVRAGWRLGLSATPLDRTDQKTILGLATMGPVVHRVSATKLADEGRILLPIVRIIPVLERAGEWCESYAEVYDELVVNSEHRNNAVLRVMELEREAGNLPGIVFVKKLDHGRALRDAARMRGLNVDFICGKDDRGRRQRALDQLASGRLDYVVGSKVFVEGVNVPALRTGVNAAGGQSIIDALQQVGRTMRVERGKPRPHFYDFGDKGHPWLHEHARTRFKAYRREGYDREVVRDLWPARPPGD